MKQNNASVMHQPLFLCNICQLLITGQCRMGHSCRCVIPFQNLRVLTVVNMHVLHLQHCNKLISLSAAWTVRHEGSEIPRY